MVIHTVRSGDSLFSIAKIYNINPLKIVTDNDLTNPNSLVIGQALVILPKYISYVVQPGDSLYNIARKYNINVQDIIQQNQALITNPITYPGQVLNIPQEKKLGTIDINGYALPNIEQTTLEQTLPYLTYLSIFSYEVRADGSLKVIDDTNLIRTARSRGVAPLMVISNIKEGGGFNSQVARIILQNKNVQETLINNVITTLRNKNYYGLDVDLEFIYPADKDLYIAFLNNIATRLKGLGYMVTVALTPKVSANQKGLLYEAHDYTRAGTIADHAILMIYEWRYIYGPSMAVSPLNQVKRVLDYAISAIPSYKILMGIPNYGYNWTLPYTQGSVAETITNPGGIELALVQKAAIQFDNVSKTPFFNYYDRSKRKHVVWFEDARSTFNKLTLVKQYGLGGVSYWTINNYFKQSYIILSSMYDIRKVI